MVVFVVVIVVEVGPVIEVVGGLVEEVDVDVDVGGGWWWRCGGGLVVKIKGWFSVVGSYAVVVELCGFHVSREREREVYV